MRGFVSPLHFDVSRIRILSCRKGWHTSSVTKEGGWNRKIRRATEPAIHAPSNGRQMRAHGSRTISGGAPSQDRKPERGVAPNR
jgi:hypothetical protein